jgi:hypothetical protein
MIEERLLKRALQQAGAAVSPALPDVTAEQLLAAVPRRRARAVKVRMTVALAGMALAMAILARSGTRERPGETPPMARGTPALTIEQIRLELAQLEREAAIRLRVARALADAERLAAQEAQSHGDNQRPELWRQEMSRSAAISWQYATMVERDFHDAKRARREYRRISDRFPDTPWAALAAASLDRLSGDDANHSEL